MSFDDLDDVHSLASGFGVRGPNEKSSAYAHDSTLSLGQLSLTETLNNRAANLRVDLARQLGEPVLSRALAIVAQAQSGAPNDSDDYIRAQLQGVLPPNSYDLIPLIDELLFLESRGVAGGVN